MVEKYSSSVLYVLLTAISFNFLNYFSRSSSPYIILFSGCIIAVCFFHCVNYNHIKKIYLSCIKDKYSWLKIMLLILVNWVTAFLATCHGSAFTYIFFSFAISALFGLGYSYWSSKRQSSMIYIIIVVIIVGFSGICTMIGQYASGLAVCFAILSGISGYYYSVESAYFSKNNNLSASQILAARFWLLLIFSGTMLYFDSHNSLNVKTISYGCIIGFSTFIIPIYLFQHGVLKLGANRNSVIRGFTPFIAILMQYIIYSQATIIEFIMSFLLGMALAFSIIRSN